MRNALDRSYRDRLLIQASFTSLIRTLCDPSLSIPGGFWLCHCKSYLIPLWPRSILMIPPHLQSIFKSLSWCSVSDDWLPSFLPWKHRDSPPQNPPAPLPPGQWWNDDWSFSWINKDPGSLLGWSAGYVEVTQICRKSASSGQLSFSLVKMQSNLTVSLSVKHLLAKTEHSSLTQDVPLKCWRKKKAGLTPEGGTRWCCELHHDMFKARVSTISTRYSTAPSRNRHQNNNKYVKVSGIFLCKLLG